MGEYGRSGVLRTWNAEDGAEAFLSLATLALVEQMAVRVWTCDGACFDWHILAVDTDGLHGHATRAAPAPADGYLARAQIACMTVPLGRFTRQTTYAD